jgi:hypothetical protein
MRRKTRYFSRDGRELSEAEALDANGIMRSGVIARVPLMTDGRALFDSGQLVVIDFDSTGSSGNRPGWRCSDSPIHRQAVNDARAAYLHDLQTAYKNPSGFGERGMIGQREGIYAPSTDERVACAPSTANCAAFCPTAVRARCPTLTTMSTPLPTAVRWFIALLTAAPSIRSAPGTSRKCRFCLQTMRRGCRSNGEQGNS